MTDVFSRALIDDLIPLQNEINELQKQRTEETVQNLARHIDRVYTGTFGERVACEFEKLAYTQRDEGSDPPRTDY